MDEKKKWKRKLPYRIYDYNYRVGESYYNPQTDYIENRELLRSKQQPPEAASYAERFANKPFYGKTRGLPYETNESALSQPLVNRRASSGGRSSRGSEPDDIPQPSRSGRNRDRKLSFSFDEPEPEPRRRFSLVDDLDFKIPVRRYIDSDFGFKTSVGKDAVSGDDFGINPAAKKGLMDDIKKLEKKFQKADLIERGTGSRAKKWEEVVYNEALDAPGKRTVKQDQASYTIPGTGSTVRKSSYQETSKFESSKPPRAPPRPSRLLSLEDDADFKLPPRPRRRNVSLSDDDFSFSSSRSIKSIVDDEDKKFRSAKKMFDQRKAQESEELTDNINKMIKKMRKHSIGDGDAYKYSRTLRSSSLDPYESEPRVKSRSHQFTYGFSK
ncbi:uncharacterized protein LOC121870985 [Homarus americanus]|uniref:Uncharacterized protein n=1 Tax=Homarus americanus TaxID=6706 RepID=A0A8J5K1A2_HOMAM|nr:uncharacterized protein LOC121870985 [Homarus americanus]XP_042228921.1 uncharacterized protein LOC121870985 [Homarus americanus]XP_042228923.1 uncharacterized protein LOC121870985 [Homarus americanus]KAG7164965.1 hypothetical protein Hamer_G004694 [Homarus americanus]